MRNWQFSEVAVTLRADALPPEGTPPRTYCHSLMKLHFRPSSFITSTCVSLS